MERVQSLLKELAKKLARLLLGDYSVFQVYSRPTQSASPCQRRHPQHLTVVPVDEAAINSSLDPLIREQVGYAGPGAHAYACIEKGRIVGVCFYWYGDRYLQRNFWPLVEGEAKLVQIVSLPDVRGQGVATMLIASSCHDMGKKGFHHAYARVWHSNTPSLRAFERSGWTRTALVIEINPLRQKRPIRLRFDRSLEKAPAPPATDH